MKDERPAVRFERMGSYSRRNSAGVLTYPYADERCVLGESDIVSLYATLARGNTPNSTIRALAAGLVANYPAILSAHGVELTPRGLSCAGPVKLARFYMRESWDSAGEFTLQVPLAGDLARRSQAIDILHEAFLAAGTRPQASALLTWELAGDPDLSPIIAGVKADHTLASMAALQTAWRAELPARLNAEVACGARSHAHADLIAELHLDLSPLEHSLLRRLLRNSRARSHVTAFAPATYYYDDALWAEPPLLEAQTAAPAIAHLTQTGWIERAQIKTNWQGVGWWLAYHGPKARRLSRFDLVGLE